ncbi:unnamed protein product [Darwinula stevensoni]|uniref:Beta-1,4-glucuronyltransferase 1 n=1 Tax=Darwinula stevensoni TaxID=69355 RepID=A0A7R9FTB1_9CRUS|nr:unnamed protein product [Darwinula stevensoni]CAG0905059.1 unnamed protein product [Darwinula stevensoni]
MSVALFLWSEKDIEPTIKAIQCLRASYPLLKQHATFSFSYHRYIQQEESDWKFWNESCDTIDEALNRLSSGKENFLGTRTPYPISLMRNVARKSARTHFFTICDMDITPSIGLRTSFLQMVKKEGLLNKEDVLYIMPVFELQKEAPIPTNKLELRTLFQNGSARQFYATWSPLTQGKTDYSRWFALPPSDGVRIAYEVEWGFLYEPYFILTSSAPDYYEGIKEITYDRGSYACELSARGWRFFVLDNAFALHDGFKASDTFEYVRSKFLRKELSKNAINHRIYRAELLAKYGSKAKKCSSLYYRTMEVFLVLGGNI